MGKWAQQWKLRVDEFLWQKNKKVPLRISYILLNYILVIDGHLAMKYLKLKFPIHLESCHYRFYARSPRCLVAIKVVIVSILKEITERECPYRQTKFGVNLNAGMGCFWSFQACFYVIGQRYQGQSKIINHYH